MFGVDISHWNTGVNIATGIDFVIVKLTQGTDFTDNMASHFIGEAAKNSKLLGVYHFASGYASPEHEADFFAAKMREFGILKKALPVLDFEVSTGDDRNWVERFATAFFNNTGIYPVIYTSASWLKKFNGSFVASKCPLWVAGYPSPRTSWPENTAIPYNLSPWQSAIIWQFTSSLILNGYRPLDGDIAYITTDQWKALAKGQNSTPVQPDNAKSLSKIADEVIAGKWGNGQERKLALERAGYDYRAVQHLVNAKLAPTKKSIDELAREVIAGKWGNGAARRNALNGAGYDYNTVQRRVNEILR